MKLKFKTTILVIVAFKFLLLEVSLASSPYFVFKAIRNATLKEEQNRVELCKELKENAWVSMLRLRNSKEFSVDNTQLADEMLSQLQNGIDCEQVD